MNATGHCTNSAIITPAQIRAARGLLDWSRDTLAVKSGISLRTLVMIEAGDANPRADTMLRICEALFAAGVRFVESNGGGPGVRLRRKR